MIEERRQRRGGYTFVNAWGYAEGPRLATVVMAPPGHRQCARL